MMTLKDTLKQIIVTNQNSFRESYNERELIVERIPRKATVIIGVRRCGKTCYLLNYVHGLLRDGVDKTRICHIDFADDRLMELMKSEEPGIIADAYYELYPENHGKKAYFVFDELQLVRHWEFLVNRLLTTEECEVNISGSSAKMLIEETSSVLGGRKLCWRLYCYSYAEFLRALGEDAKLTYDKHFLDKQPSLFQKYLEVGGFPEAILFHSEQGRFAFFQNIFNDIIYRDVVLRHDISKPMEMKALSTLVLSMMGCLCSENKLYQRLDGMQYKISKVLMSEYLSYLEETNAVFFIPIRSYNASVRRSNPKKIYVADHALASSCTHGLSENTGAKLENIVFLHIKRKCDDVYYYLTAKGHEIDFLIGKDDDLHIVQVCVSLQDAETRKREIRAVAEAMGELKIERGRIVTLDEEEEVVVPEGRIVVLPAWKYLLQE
jgi:predicted AAA+ superfamily ATPase